MAELKKNHGEIGEALQKRIGEVTDEFSLDKEDSALSRLVGRVEAPGVRSLLNSPWMKRARLYPA